MLFERVLRGADRRQVSCAVQWRRNLVRYATRLSGTLLVRLIGNIVLAIPVAALPRLPPLPPLPHRNTRLVSVHSNGVDNHITRLSLSRDIHGISFTSQAIITGSPCTMLHLGSHHHRSSRHRHHRVGLSICFTQMARERRPLKR
jgi:hypothetical protein